MKQKTDTFIVDMSCILLIIAITVVLVYITVNGLWDEVVKPYQLLIFKLGLGRY